jgi:serine protease inhibitor
MIAAPVSAERDRALRLSIVEGVTYALMVGLGETYFLANAVRAAVTPIGFETTSVGESTPVMNINRPFMYVIREKTSNALVFMGTVGAPEYD